MISKTTNFLLDILLPKTCLICGAFDTFLCTACQEKIVGPQQQLCPVCAKASITGKTHDRCASKNTLDGLFAAGNFGQLQGIIHSYKYGLVTELHQQLGKILTKFVTNNSLEEFIKQFRVIPVPLHKARKRFRGFNQSEILAAQMCKKLQMAMDTKSLTRIKNTTPQTKLDRKNRYTNIEKAFRADRINIQDKKILLIDDIATTGATLNECAKTAKSAGATEVWALVLAHG